LILQVRNGITVFNSGGQVVAVTQAGSSETPKDVMLTPEFADAFVYLVDGSRVMMRFTRNKQNAVSGFTLSTGDEFIRRLRLISNSSA
jgi:hypothetical protein